MDLVESFKMSVATLTSNKVRSALTMLGIIIGNASVVAMIGIGQGTQKLANDQFSSLGPNTLFITPGSRRGRTTSFDLPKTLVLADAEAIESQVPSVEGVAPEINTRRLITFRNKNMNSQVAGVTADYFGVRDHKLKNGRFVNKIDVDRNQKVAVVGSEIVNRLFAGQNPVGQQIRVQNLSFEVVGVLQPKGSFFGSNQDDLVVIPLSVMSSQLAGNNSPYGIQLSWINVKAKDETKIRAAKFQIENLLRLRHKIVNEDDFQVDSAKQLLDTFGTITQGLTLLLALIAGISLLVGGIGVMNIMLVSVTERTQEIGLRKAIGAQEHDILLQFLIEAILLSAAGGIIGIALGSSAVVLVSTFSPLTGAAVSPFAVLLSLSVSSGIGLFFGVFPAYRASKLDPIVALRSI
ncbi:MAG: Macrolide export ATP-binding/permease protein MacB [Chroococcopsis gigantea SAG 12.99]|jgi:putative ABC transport system permease protein|nr:ABC transporter permease [Chlorogloea purpurea SAG 13.99]MDV2999247.1 Macrolide export ATP-binding/permease protein MacB [Chroococcopsis gigantea SAG 12.99]